MDKLPYDMKIVPAIAANDGTVGTMTPVEVNCSGYDRVCYVASLGTAGSGGLFDMKVQDSATSGGSLADVTGAALTQVTKAAGDGKLEIVDLPINGARPYHKLTVVTTTAAFPNSVIAILYHGSRQLPPTQVAGQTVIL